MSARLKVLKKLKYINNSKLTTKGEFAKKVHGYGLILSELYASGDMELLNYKEIATLALAVVFEPKPGARMPRLPEMFKNLRFQTSGIINNIHDQENLFNVKSLSKKCYYDLSIPLAEWMKEKPFEDIVSMIKIDDGELIRYYRMSIQVMRELLRTSLSDILKGSIETAIALINHGVMDAENQLKNVVNTIEVENIEEKLL